VCQKETAPDGAFGRIEDAAAVKQQELQVEEGNDNGSEKMVSK
jgi:hypothetical protein